MHDRLTQLRLPDGPFGAEAGWRTTQIGDPNLTTARSDIYLKF